MANRKWDRDELILAMNLYCQLPFGKFHARNPRVIQLAGAINRTPSSVAMKLCNLASLDPDHGQRGVRGLSRGSHGDRAVWDEFHNDWSKLAEESERLRLGRVELPPVQTAQPAQHHTDNDTDLTTDFGGQTERTAISRVRLAQRFFRRSVLASYDSRCCVSDIRVAMLLVASHILPWSAHSTHRTDPRNGLCLSRLHDAAFDRGLITFDEEHRLILSRELADHATNRVLRESFHVHEGKPICLPNKFRPSVDFLAIHRATIFRG